MWLVIFILLYSFLMCVFISFFDEIGVDNKLGIIWPFSLIIMFGVILGEKLAEKYKKYFDK